MNKLLYIFLLSCLFVTQAFSQEVLQSLISNPLPKTNSKNHLKSAKQSNEIILPLFDDFSYATESNTTKPDTILWAKGGVTVNYNYARNPITIGVATFDAIGPDGRLYPGATSVSSFNADTLTSVDLDLSTYSLSDNISLSFFYQRGGFGELPEVQDSFFVMFRKPGTTEVWDTMWRAGGTGKIDTFFTQVEIPITDAAYLKAGFQFRFFIKSSLNIVDEPAGKNTNGDIWNLDYVYLSANKKFNGTNAYKNEVSFVYPLQHSLLKNFEVMPWRQYSLPDVSIKESTAEFEIPIINHWDSSLYTIAEITFRDKGDSRNFEKNTGVFALEADTVRNFKYSTSNITPTNKDSAEIELTVKLIIDDDNFQGNNTFKYSQKFGNYFAYDDGSAEFGYGIAGQGTNNALLAMRFATYRPDTLSAVQMYFNESIPSVENVSRSFYLIVWNERDSLPGDTLYKKFISDDFLNLNIGWASISIDTTVVLPERYFIGWAQTTNYFANIGFDRNRNAKKNTFFNLLGAGLDWRKSEKEGALMIRPVIKKNFYNMAIPTSAKEFKIEKLSPNPASTNITFELSQKSVEERYRIQITNITGALNIIREQTDKTIDISNLQPGVYILKVTSPSGQTSTSKFIKSNW